MMEGGMSHMMAMMEMMHRQMMPMDMGMAGMQPVRHIDGQIAFYKAELKITDAQSPQWNAFADALRGSATRLHQINGTRHRREGGCHRARADAAADHDAHGPA